MIVFHFCVERVSSAVTPSKSLVLVFFLFYSSKYCVCDSVKKIDEGNRVCSIKQQIDISSLHNLDAGVTRGRTRSGSSSSNGGHARPLTQGAILSVGTDKNAKIGSKWDCQLKTHDAYCLKHGYQCYFITDILLWENERLNKSHWVDQHGPKLLPHWLKVQVLPHILELHPWVFYLDTDSVFTDPLNVPSIESLLAKVTSPKASILMPDFRVGWDTSMIFLRRTPFSFHFLNHLWDLRRYCPNCVAEQCAAHVALFDFILRIEYETTVFSGKRDDNITVMNGKDNRVCCQPRAHCEFPDGFRRFNRRMSYPGDSGVQGCVWNWQRALGHFYYDHDTVKPPVIDHFSWDVDLRVSLNITHPVKTMTCSDSTLKSTLFSVSVLR